ALVRGRDYVVPQDVVDVLPDVLRHRLVLTYDALADDVSADTVVRRVLEAVPLPQISAVPAQQGEGQHARPQQGTGPEHASPRPGDGPPARGRASTAKRATTPSARRRRPRSPTSNCS